MCASLGPLLQAGRCPWSTDHLEGLSCAPEGSGALPRVFSCAAPARPEQTLQGASVCLLVPSLLLMGAVRGVSLVPGVEAFSSFRGNWTGHPEDELSGSPVRGAHPGPRQPA